MESPKRMIAVFVPWMLVSLGLYVLAFMDHLRSCAGGCFPRAIVVDSLFRFELPISRAGAELSCENWR
jgi:hypothetical protein